MDIYTLLIFAFILYYAYALFVIYKLFENKCNCSTLTEFKTTWNYNFILYVTPLLFVGNAYLLINRLSRGAQKGGGLLLLVSIFLFVQFGTGFLNDFAIIDLLQKMDDKQCPCSQEYRQPLKVSTYVKAGINSVLVLSAIGVLQNPVKFNRVLKRVKKR